MKWPHGSLVRSYCLVVPSCCARHTKATPSVTTSTQRYFRRFSMLWSKGKQIKFDNILIPITQFIKHAPRGRFIEINPRDGGLSAFEDDVLHLLHVDPSRLDCVEHLRQNAGPIAMTHHQTMRCR